MGLLAWDCYLAEGGVLGDVRESMVEATECTNILEVHEMNFLMQGQKRSASGNIFGYRFVLECEEGIEEELAETLSQTKIEGTSGGGHVWAMRSLAYLQDGALRYSDAGGIPGIGAITISVRVSDGWGAIGEKQYNSIRNNQVKDTKNVLNLCSTKYNSSPKNSFLNDALASALTERGWFLVKRLKGEGSGLTRSVGGSYQFGYNLENILDVLVNESEGVWWNPLEDKASRIEVDCGGDLKIDQNPKGWFHHSVDFRRKIDSGWNSNDDGDGKWGETETGCSSAVGYELRRSMQITTPEDYTYTVVKGPDEDGKLQIRKASEPEEVPISVTKEEITLKPKTDEASGDIAVGDTVTKNVVDDIHYVCDRFSSTEPPVDALTIDDGLVEGQEKHLVRELILRPWITREFFHLIQAFLMTRSPRDWMNGSGEIRLLTSRLQ